MEIEAFLADSVVAAEGKLYVQGAGWNVINAQNVPFSHDRIGVGVLVHVPYTATNQMHAMEFSLEDADGTSLPIGDAPPGVETPDGKIRTFTAQFNVGRPSTIQPGDDQMIPFALNVNGLLLERADRYCFVIRIDGTEAKRLCFRVNQLMQLQPGVGS